jgi:iron complex transport system ATP-binding protein
VWGHQEYATSQQEMARATLHELEIEDLAERRYETLSTGQQRRLLLGRALVNQPNSLLLDEPTSGLDLAATFNYLKTLRRLILHGRTVVLVTHHIHEIPPEIERVVLLDAGRITADGHKRVVLSSQSLSLLFGESINLIESDGWYQATPA